MNNSIDAISGVLFASILLAGTTLTIYKCALQDLDVSVRKAIEKKMKDMLVRLLGYD